MGSQSSKPKSHAAAVKYGQIYLDTDKPAYYSGERVSGRIYLNMFQPYPAKQLFLKLKGKESAFWVDTRRETNLVDGRSRNVDYLMQEKLTIIKSIVPVHSWDTLLPGQFVIPYNFLLPEGLPSSFSQEGHKYHANISYQIEAIIEPNVSSEPKIKCKQPVIVRQPIRADLQSYDEEITTDLETCLCCKQGSNKLRVQFEKNVYYPSEIARVQVKLDNTQSKIRNEQISFELIQKLAIHAAGKTLDKDLDKITQTLDGIPAKNEGPTMQITLNLPPFECANPKPHKKSDMITYLRSLKDNDAFIHPATRGKLITSEYYLKVYCQMEGCLSISPNIKCPITVLYPDVQPEVPVAPNNWNPQSIEAVNVSFGGAALNIPEQRGPALAKITPLM